MVVLTRDMRSCLFVDRHRRTGRHTAAAEVGTERKLVRELLQSSRELVNRLQAG